MSGETNLDVLLNGMQPELHAGEYVFCTLPENQHLNQRLIGMAPIGMFRESEGITVILAKSQADALAFPYSFVSAWITLTVHSALDAVGLTAAVSQALAKAEISCNVIAAYYHDHLFVPIDAAERAVSILNALSASVPQSK